MTQFLWDTSHFDGPLSRATLATAKARGIVALTHKVGEGTGGDDPLDGTVLAAARDAGIALLGGYHVVRSGPVGPQVDELLALADRDEPWWRRFPGWFWQADLERWSYDQVPAETGIQFAEELRARTGKVVVLYASRGQYGDQLRAWDGPLWNARYVSSSVTDFKRLYPGDGWVGWSSYSGREPDFLQYSSSATIAGVTTCDISAYRGTLAELTALLTGGHMPLRDDPDFLALIKRVEALYSNKVTADFQIPGENAMRHEVNALGSVLAKAAAPPVVDPVALTAAIRGVLADPATLVALAHGVADELQRRLAS